MSAAAGVYTDFGGLASLRAQARRDDPAARAEVATQFEALFFQMMLKSMRAASGEDPLLGRGGEMYRDMFDQQISLHLASARRSGIAELFERRIGDSGGPLHPAPGASSPLRSWPGVAPAIIPESVPADVSTIDSPESRDARTAAPATHGPAGLLDDFVGPFATPDDFVRSMWPHAVRAGETLGVDPELVVAQAALETGWGRHGMRHADGRSANNFFGIKADSRWSGPHVTRRTLEHIDGALVQVSARFRAYASPAQGFDDYVSFVRDQPRYAAAMRAVERPEAYIRALHDAGYATDPDYADKVLSVMERIDVHARTGR